MSFTTMDSIIPDILRALDIWLAELEGIEQRNLKLDKMRARINRTVDQIHMEGLLSIPDMARLEYVAKLWVDVLALIQTGDKRILVTKILQLFDSGEISLVLTSEMICSVCVL